MKKRPAQREEGYQPDRGKPQRGGKPFGGDKSGQERPARPQGRKPFREGKSESPYPPRPQGRKPFADNKTERPYSSRTQDKSSSSENRPGRPYSAHPKGRKPFQEDRPEKSYGARGPQERRPFRDDKPERPFDPRSRDRKPFTDERPGRTHTPRAGERNSFREDYSAEDRPARKPSGRATIPKTDRKTQEIPLMPLNKYIAHSGICSRRDAADLVKEGKILVNGKPVLEPGYKVQPSDVVTLSGKKLAIQKDLVYLLLNKPKGFLTTTEDPRERKTVMSLVTGAPEGRLFPVGRLDMNTTGLLLITNDGDLAQKLAHPKYNIRKIYQVTLNKPLTKAHFEQILEGVTLEDGQAPVDSLAYLTEKHEIGIEIHIGKNRIVRRIFESLGYDVVKLDRVMYAGLTKKNIPRGKWRPLTEEEIVRLKHFKN